MLDELREQAESSVYEDEEENGEGPTYFRMRYQSDTPFLGMTPGQRLVIAIMLLVATCVLGVSALLVTGTVIP